MLSSQRSCIILSQSQRKLRKNTCCMAWPKYRKKSLPSCFRKWFFMQSPSHLYVCVLCWVASVVSNLLQPYWLWPIRLLCPWYSPGRCAGVGFLALIQGIFPTQGSNLLHPDLWTVAPTLSWSQQTAPPLLSIGQLQGRTVSGLPSHHPHFHPTFPHLILVALFTPL